MAQATAVAAVRHAAAAVLLNPLAIVMSAVMPVIEPGRRLAMREAVVPKVVASLAVARTVPMAIHLSRAPHPLRTAMILTEQGVTATQVAARLLKIKNPLLMKAMYLDEAAESVSGVRVGLVGIMSTTSEVNGYQLLLCEGRYQGR